VVVVAVRDASLALLVGAAVVVASRSAVFKSWGDHDGCSGGVVGEGDWAGPYEECRLRLLMAMVVVVVVVVPTHGIVV
jgi:hypothetical protein